MLTDHQRCLQVFRVVETMIFPSFIQVGRIFLKRGQRAVFFICCEPFLVCGLMHPTNGSMCIQHCLSGFPIWNYSGCELALAPLRCASGEKETDHSGKYVVCKQTRGQLSKIISR